MQLSIFDALITVELPTLPPAEVQAWDWHPNPIKLLSLHQPWASLVVELLKLWETRPPTISWRNYRGPLAIHAAKQIDWDAVAEIQREFGDMGLDWENLPLGAIVGVAEMTACATMTPELIAQQTPLELAVGNWEAGRLAIRLERVVKLPEAIPARGLQGLTGLPAEVEAEVRRSLGLPVPPKSEELEVRSQESDGKCTMRLPSQNPEPVAIATPEPAPEVKPKRAIRQPPPPKAPSQWKHFGKPQEPSLCGLTNVSYYLTGSLTAWQMEGVRSRICPECLELWEKPKTEAEPKPPEPEVEALSCPISPTATVRLWMIVGTEFRDVGTSAMVSRARREAELASWWFPVAEDGTPIHPGKPIPGGYYDPHCIL